jgi:hypothetical protein
LKRKIQEKNTYKKKKEKEKRKRRDSEEGSEIQKRGSDRYWCLASGSR